VQSTNVTGRQFLNEVANGKRDILAAVLRILRHTQAPYCVIGGAVSAYAEPLVSLDLDIVVALNKVEEVCAAAEAQGLMVRRFEHGVNLSSPDSDLRSNSKPTSASSVKRSGQHGLGATSPSAHRCYPRRLVVKFKNQTPLTRHGCHDACPEPRWSQDP